MLGAGEGGIRIVPHKRISRGRETVGSVNSLWPHGRSVCNRKVMCGQELTQD